MKKRFLQFAFAFLFLAGGSLSAFAAPVLGGGDGSQGTPYLIRTAAQFDSIQHCPTNNAGGAGQYFRLENDINLSTSTAGNFVFKGNLDGQNFVVKGKSAQPIFSAVDGATVSNLLVDLQGTVANTFGNTATGTVLFDNCRVFTTAAGDATSGVFVGTQIAGGDLTIRNSFAGVKFAGSTGGGLVGEVRGQALIEGSQYWSPATVGAGSYFGGLVGAVTNGQLTVQNSNVANLDIQAGANNNIGGLVGGATLGKVCIYNSSVINFQISGTGKMYGGLVGSYDLASESDSIVGSYVLLGGNISGADQLGGLVGDVNRNVSGSLTVEKSYVGVLNIGVNAQVVATAAANGIGGLIGSSRGNAVNMTDCSVNAQASLQPTSDMGTISIIGGTTDGYLGGLIGNMNIGSLTNCFVYLGEGIGTTPGYIDGSSVATGAIGGLVGSMGANSSVSKCFVNIGQDNNTTKGIEIANGSKNVGGMVGLTSANCIIQNSFAFVSRINDGALAASLASTSFRVGGIAGYLDLNGTISNCWFQGKDIIFQTTPINTSADINRIVGSTNTTYTLSGNKANVNTKVKSATVTGFQGDKNGADDLTDMFAEMKNSSLYTDAPYLFAAADWTFPGISGKANVPQQNILKPANAYLVYNQKNECSNAPTAAATLYGFNLNTFSYVPVNEGGVLGAPVTGLSLGTGLDSVVFTPTYAVPTFANGPVTYALQFTMGTPAVTKTIDHIKVSPPAKASVIMNTRTICDNLPLTALNDTVLVKFTGGFAPYTFDFQSTINGTATTTTYTFGEIVPTGIAWSNDSIARIPVNPANADFATWAASLSEYELLNVKSTLLSGSFCNGSVPIPAEIDSIFANPVYNQKLATANLVIDSVVCAGSTVNAFAYAAIPNNAFTAPSIANGNWYYVWSDKSGRATSIGMATGRDSAMVTAPTDSVKIAQFIAANTIGRSDSAQIYAYAMFKNKVGHMCYASDSAYIELQVNPTPNLRFKVDGQTTLDGYQIACNGAQSDYIYFVTGINTAALNPMDTVYYQWTNEMNRKDKRYDSVPFSPVYSIRNAADYTTYTSYIAPFNVWNDGVYVVPNAVRDTIVVAAYFVDGYHNNLVCTSDTLPTVIQINPTTTIVDQLIGAKYCDAKDTVAHISTYGVDVSYQWYKNDFAEKTAVYEPIPNATRSTQRLSDNAYYYVKVSSLCGTFNSDTARFDFAKSPEFITDLSGRDTSICAGSNAVLTSAVKGAIGYQWFFDGDSIKGATKATYTVTNADSEKDYGYYNVRAIAACDNYSVDSKSNRVWVASPLTNLEIKGLPNPVDLNKEYEISIDSAGRPYDDVTYYVWSFSNSNAKFEANAGDETFYVNKVVFGPTAENGVMTVKLSHVCGTNGIYTVTKNVNMKGSSISELNNGTVVVYPNPVVDELFIDNANGTVNEVTVTDLNGRKVASYSNLNSVEVITISAANWNNGVYFVTITTDNGTDTAKIIKK